MGASQVLLHPPAVAEAGQRVREGPFQQFEVGLLELVPEVRHLAVQIGHPLGRHQTRLYGEGIDRLDQIVIGACTHAFEDLLGVPEPGDQDDVDVADHPVPAVPVGTARVRRRLASANR